MVARVTVRVSDLTGNQIPEDDSQVARLIVEHPDYPEPVGLDVLPEEVTPYLDDEATRFVVLSLETPDNPNPDKRYAMSIEDFNTLFQDGDSQSALEQAYSNQQEVQRQQQKSRRKGAGKRGGGRQQKRGGSRESRQHDTERVDYASPEYAGLPHPGTISEREKEYVRNNLEVVNRWRSEQGHEELDPNDPRTAARYGFPAPLSNTTQEDTPTRNDSETEEGQVIRSES